MEISEVLESINLCITSKAKACAKCRYKDAGSCAVDMMKDAVKAIEAQQKRIAELKADREALCLIVKNISDCTHCKYVSRSVAEEPCNDCAESRRYPYWEWAGVKPEVDNG